MSYEDAMAVQRCHEQLIMALPGVHAVGVKQRDGGLVLEVTVDPSQELPDELVRPDIDGLPLVVERDRYELQ